MRRIRKCFIMERLEAVRQVVDEHLRRQPDEEERRCGFVHLYGVSGTCMLLAIRRGLDPEICAVAGLLHDIATYQTADPHDHDRRGAVEAGRILREVGLFSEGEISAVCDAIAKHSTKGEIDDPLAELLKDADVLQHYIYNTGLADNPVLQWPQRLTGVLNELGIQPPQI
jgi:uncharacterized protein